jgi:sirohydrochlorin cobaltochelatase
MARVGVVLVGHGQLPSDIPKELGSEYLKLKFKENRTRMEEERFEELENVVLNWARNEVNDPYAHSLQTLASELSKIGGYEKVVVAFNEFCRPTVEEALVEVCNSDVDVVVVVTTMTTKGGEHSEKDMPELLEKMRKKCLKQIVYAWPFDVRAVARLLVETINLHLSRMGE